MRDWFGPEPQLGVILAMVSMPIIAALGYIVIFGAIREPTWFLIFAGLYAAGVGFRFVLGRLDKQTAARVNRIVDAIAFLGFIGWAAWLLTQAWLQDGWKGLLVSLAVMSAVALIVWIAGKRADGVDYSTR